jgi:hypothetical protein
MILFELQPAWAVVGSSCDSVCTHYNAFIFKRVHN